MLLGCNTNYLLWFSAVSPDKGLSIRNTLISAPSAPPTLSSTALFTVTNSCNEKRSVTDSVKQTSNVSPLYVCMYITACESHPECELGGIRCLYGEEDK